jgi:hypothetical protein
MKKITAYLMAFCFGGVLSAQAEVTFLEGGQYQVHDNEKPLRVYQDLGDRSSQTGSIREGAVLINNEVAKDIQFGWPTDSQKFALINNQDGTATWYIGEGVDMTATNVPYTWTEGENALYFQIFAQSNMSPSSPTKGISLSVTKVNGTTMTNTTMSRTFSYPNTGNQGFAVLYGFEGPFRSIEGTINLINAQGAQGYGFSFTIGTGEYEVPVEPGPEGIVEFDSATASVTEGSAELRIPVSRNQGSTGAVTVDYTLFNGTAIKGEDYSTSNGTLTFGPGETEKEIVVAIDDDRYIEESESLSVTLSNPQGGLALGEIRNATVTIEDDDDDIVDIDADHMDDAWEAETFGDLTVANTTSDYDWDGVLDLDEYYQMLNPKDPQVADALIGSIYGPMQGENVFDRSGFTETLTAKKKGGTSCWIYAKNAGDVTRKLALRANGGSRHFGVKFYRVDGTDITFEVVNGMFCTADLPPQGGEYIRVEIARKKNSRGRLRVFEVFVDVGIVLGQPLRQDRNILKIVSKTPKR